MPEPLRISVSQMGNFASCEQKWAYKLTAGSNPADSKPTPIYFLLGTLWGRLQAAWYSGRDWRTEFGRALAEDDFYEDWMNWPEEFERAYGFMEEWEEIHGARPAELVVATELPFDLPVPGVPGVNIRGFLDGVLATNPDSREPSEQGLTVLEIKTMGRWGRDSLAPVDPQLHTYAWAARQMFPVSKLRFEATSTYNYKDPKPGHRFRRIEFDIDQKQVDRAISNMQNMARRMKAIAKKPEIAVLNISTDSCGRCDYKDICWDVAS